MKSLSLFLFLMLSCVSAYAVNVPVRFGEIDINTPKLVNVAKGITTNNYAFIITSITKTVNGTFTIVDQECQIGSIYTQEYCDIIVRFQTSGFTKQTANLTVNVTFYPDPDMMTSFNRTYVFQMSGTGIRRLADSEECCLKKGSIINVDNTSVSESIPLTGVPYKLAYASDVSTYNELQLFGLNGFTLDGFKFYDADRGNTVSADGKVNKAPSLNIGGLRHTLSPDGSELYEFDPDGFISAVYDPLLGVQKAQFDYEYDYETGNAGMQITDTFGNVTLYAKTGNTATITSPYGQVTSLAINPTTGVLTSVTNPNSEIFQVGFNADGKLTSLQKPGGQTSTLAYNATTNRLSSNAAPGGYTQTLTNTVTTSGTTQTQTTAIKTPLNITTTSVFASKANGSTATVTAPNSRTSTRTVVTGVSDTSSNSYGYSNTKTKTPDPRFGLTSPYVSKDVTTVSGTSINIVRDIAKTATLASSDPLSHTSLVTTTKLQNAANRIFTSTFTRSTRTLVDQSPLARTMTRIYNFDGTLGSEQVGTLDPTSYTYNLQGLPVTIERSTRTSTLTYNVLGQLDSFTNPYYEVEYFGYDLAGRLTQKTHSDWNTTQYVYDANGRMTELKVPGTNTHSFAYNNFDLVSSYTPPVVGSGGIGNISYTYNLDKQLKTTTFSDGKVITNNYSTTTGFLTTKVASDTSGNYSYAYKAATDLISQIISPDAVNLAITYVADKVQKYVTTIPSVVTTEYSRTFDTEFRTSSETIKVGTVSAPAINFTYDLDGIRTGAGDITQVINTNGLMSSNTIGSVVEMVERNSFGEVITRRTYHGGVFIYEELRTLDNLGRVTAVTEVINGVTTTKGYTYDNRGRLKNINESGYTPFYTYYYSENGNRLSYTTPGGGGQTYAYDAQDRIQTVNNYVFTHNTRGDLVTSLFTYLNQTTSFNYDIYSQLRSATLPDGKIISYKLDGYGRRVARYVNGVYNRGFIYNDRNQIVAELNASKVLAIQYVYLTRPNVPDYAIIGATKLKIVSNEVGTPKMLVNTATGAVVETIATNEFGAGSLSTNISLGFAGGLRDPDTNNLRFGAREYDPHLARWLSKDPIKFDGGDTNLYGYTLNDPINLVDTNGLWSITVGGYWGFGGAFVFGRNPDGRLFSGIRIGVGIGASLSFDPQGKSPGYSICGPGSSIGSYVDAGVQFGPFELGGNMSSGYSNSGLYGNPLTPAIGFTPSIGLGAGLSTGIEYYNY